MHADGVDRLLMAVGFLGCVGEGLSTPLKFLISGMTVNSIAGASPNFTDNVAGNAVKLLYLAAGSFIVAFLEGYCWTRTAQRQASRMRRRYLEAVLRQDVTYFDLKVASSTEVITSISADSLTIYDVICEKMPNLLMNFSSFFSSYAIAAILLWRLAVVCFPTVVLLLVPGLVYGQVLLGLSRRIQQEYNIAGVVAKEAVSSIRTVYSFAAEGKMTAAYSEALEASVRLGVRQGLAQGLAIGSNGVTYAIWALIAWYCSRLVMYHGAKGGTAQAAGVCIVAGGRAFCSGFYSMRYLGEAMAAAERIKGVIGRKPGIDSGSKEGVVMEEVKGEVEFREVNFAYPARPETGVLKRFSLKVTAGSTVALVGGSGSGKSTALALLQRLYDPASGLVMIDGVDLRKLRLKWVREQMGMVSQEPVLFATTIKENVVFGKEDATVEEVVAAAMAANAHDFISKLPDGYDTQVGEGGIQISGGEKQRVAIARAIIRSPKILLLDEATSAVDSHSERIVQDALDAVAVGRTTLIVAHRLSTIRNADTIAVVHDGQVVEFGTHKDLIRDANSHYSALVRLQESLPPPDPCDAAAAASFTRSSSSVPSFSRLLKMNAPKWRHMAIGCISAILSGAVQPLHSFAMGAMISVYFLTDHEEIKHKTRVYTLIIAFLALFSFLINTVQHYSFAVMGEHLTKRVRERMLSKMLTFEVGWFDEEENSSGAIYSRLAKDARVVRSLVGDRMALVIQTLSAIIIAFTTGLVIAWPLALVIISVQPLLIVCFYSQRVMLKKMSARANKAQSESSKLAAEAVANHRTITTFSSQSRILRLFEFAQAGPRREGIRHSWYAGAGLGTSQALNICSWALALWYGAFLISRGQISVKALLQDSFILISTSRVIADAGAMTTDITRGADTVASVFAILGRETLIAADDQEGHRPELLRGAIEFQRVDFAYPTRPAAIVLREFSLSLEAGKSTALVGPSGSGKSTVFGLIERFYDPLRGAIHIDGVDIRSYNLRSLRRLISLVGQEPTLFARTVRENIVYGADDGVSDAEVEAAARAANAHEFISGLSDGYQTSCGEFGAQLSGGQKQRIAIARAIVRKPAILLLDEATSALDSMSEQVVQEALDRMMVGRTSVVVAHRLSTVRNSDVIAVLEKGALVEKGSHAFLMAKGNKGKYYGLVSLQQGHL
ncbi:Putative multidrug resistance protein [Apostasia shenzhenica]|uniref:Multidrug resistance protein n=1 Tax=Apostasia shenzhenica TaxID=1088818 RepID=A0A2I0B732_9ASPA|nr:Putative multidrug resistance protein [Apostasia shenzhenica]